MARSKHTCCGGVAHSWLRSSGQEGTRPPRRMWRAHFARTFLWRGWPFGFAPFYPAQGRQVRIAPFRHQEQRDAGLKARRNMKQKARQETRQGAKALTSVPGRDAAGFPNVAPSLYGRQILSEAVLRRPRKTTRTAGYWGAPRRYRKMPGSKPGAT